MWILVKVNNINRIRILLNCYKIIKDLFVETKLKQNKIKDKPVKRYIM